MSSNPVDPTQEHELDALVQQELTFEEDDRREMLGHHRIEVEPLDGLYVQSILERMIDVRLEHLRRQYCY